MKIAFQKRRGNRSSGFVLLVVLLVLFGAMLLVEAFYQFYVTQATICVQREYKLQAIYWQQAQSRLVGYKTVGAVLNYGGVDSGVSQRTAEEVYSRDPSKMGLPQSNLPGGN